MIFLRWVTIQFIFNYSKQVNTVKRQNRTILMFPYPLTQAPLVSSHVPQILQYAGRSLCCDLSSKFHDITREIFGTSGIGFCFFHSLQLKCALGTSSCSRITSIQFQWVLRLINIYVFVHFNLVTIHARIHLPGMEFLTLLKSNMSKSVAMMTFDWWIRVSQEYFHSLKCVLLICFANVVRSHWSSQNRLT